MGLIGTPQLLDADYSIDQKYFRSATRLFRVWATEDFDEFHVTANLGIYPYNVHPSDAGARVTKVSVRLDSKNLVTYDSVGNPGGAATPPAFGTQVYQWMATVEYGPWNPLENSSDGNPADQALQVFNEPQVYQVIADVDKDGNPVVNSAYDYFDPPIMRDKTRSIIRVIRNELAFSASYANGFADSVNSDQVFSAGGDLLYDVRTLKAAAPRGVPKYSQYLGQNYYEVEYVFAYSPENWDFKVLDQGYRQLDPSDGTKRQQIYLEGQPATSPVLLSGSGYALYPPVSSSSVNYKNFRVYAEISFADSFGFPAGTFT